MEWPTVIVVVTDNSSKYDKFIVTCVCQLVDVTYALLVNTVLKAAPNSATDWI